MKIISQRNILFNVILTGTLVGKRMRIAADSSSGDPKNQKNLRLVIINTVLDLFSEKLACDLVALFARTSHNRTYYVRRRLITKKKCMQKTKKSYAD